MWEWLTGCPEQFRIQGISKHLQEDELRYNNSTGDTIRHGDNDTASGQSQLDLDLGLYVQNLLITFTVNVVDRTHTVHGDASSPEVWVGPSHPDLAGSGSGFSQRRTRFQAVADLLGCNPFWTRTQLVLAPVNLKIPTWKAAAIESYFDGDCSRKH